MRSESSFEAEGDLIIIDATVAGPKGRARARLVLDTGSTLTTLVPEIAEAIGYTSADRIARSVVRSAVAEEHGYIVCLSSLTVLGFTVAGVNANVADLGHDIDGLLGMSFLNGFNFEIRPVERRILIERIAP
jgi:clan AA aspartic protease (TIGR02281 family)